MATQAEGTIVTCPRCGQKNRIILGRPQPVCGRCGASLAPGAAEGRAADAGARPVVVTDANYTTEVLLSPLPVLLDCWAPWCGPCRAVAPIIDRLATEYAGRVKVCKLNVDENPRTAELLGVQGIPAFFLLIGGRVVDRLVGAHPYEVFKARLETLLLNEGSQRAAG